MPKTDFIPTRDGDLVGYELNFLNKLTTHAGILGIDPAEVTKITGVCLGVFKITEVYI